MAVRGFRLIPRTGRGAGSGHQRRARALEKELSARGLEIRSGDRAGTADATLAILDLRSSTATELRDAAELGTPVLLDDDGPARERAPYLVDIIPGPRSSDANITSPGFMDLPPKTRRPDASGAILVSFGGEDPSALTIPVLHALTGSAEHRRHPFCTLPEGLENGQLPDDVSVLEAPDNLRDRLAGFGLVICSYGLTAWEAIAAGCAVLTVDPTPYHARLSLNAGFPGLGHVAAGQPEMTPSTRRDLDRLLSDPAHLNRRADELRRVLEPPGSGNAGLSGLADRLASLEAVRPVCVACGEPLPPVIVRFPWRSYYRCLSCGMTGLYRFRLKEDEYGPSYFDQEYQAQYGRSYLQDFDHIREMGRRRMKLIARRARPGGSLLDIGCAFGPFLAAADELGFRPHGADVSSDGVAHVRDILGYPAVTGRFPADDPGRALGMESFDVVTLWYVIEHFPDLTPVLNALKRLTAPGGVLAFSTPNGAGISARTSMAGFLEKSPADHYSIWTPRTARRLLSGYGFRVDRIRITGHHPERFPGKPRVGSILYRIWWVVSRILGLGDTFEVYARRSGS